MSGLDVSHISAGPSEVSEDWSSRSRVLAAIDHKEPDRVPFDLGGSFAAGIHIEAYRRLLRRWEEPLSPIVENIISQKALVDERVLLRVKTDLRRIAPSRSLEALESRVTETSENYFLVDDFGIEWRMPKESGLYFDIHTPALPGKLTIQSIESLPVPAPPDPDALRNLRDSARRARDDGFAVVVDDGSCAGIFEWACCIRGHARFLMDLCSSSTLARRLLRKMLSYKQAYFESVLPFLGDLVDVVAEGDDVAAQQRMMISPSMYVDVLKPLHRELMSCIRANASTPVKIHFHSCGAIRPLIPHLIDIGVDALNPVQISAAGMAPAELKREFGRDVSFWGGGVDAQGTMPHGTPSDVEEEVKRRIGELAPGGGFIFAGIHNIQPDVPAENIIAMVSAVDRYGEY